MRWFADASRLGSVICAFRRLSARFPCVELLTELSDLSDVRFAIFLDGSEPSSEKVTSEVYEAIRWRNDPDISDNLVIVGDLERDRAARLGQCPHDKSRRSPAPTSRSADCRSPESQCTARRQSSCFRHRNPNGLA